MGSRPDIESIQAEATNIFIHGTPVDAIDIATRCIAMCSWAIELEEAIEWDIEHCQQCKQDLRGYCYQHEASGALGRNS